MVQKNLLTSKFNTLKKTGLLVINLGSYSHHEKAEFGKAEFGSFWVYSFLSLSPQRGSRCLHSSRNRKHFFRVLWTGFSNTLPSPQSLWQGIPFPASTIILGLGRRKAAKSEMCHEATGWRARTSKHKPRREQRASVSADSLWLP